MRDQDRLIGQLATPGSDPLGFGAVAEPLDRRQLTDVGIPGGDSRTAVPPWFEATRMLLRPSSTISDIGGLSLVITCIPNAVASWRQPETLARRRQADVAGGEPGPVCGLPPVLEHQLDPRIGGGRSAASRRCVTRALTSMRRRCSPSAFAKAFSTLRIGLRRPRKEPGK